jgi:hypothetical protein
MAWYSVKHRDNIYFCLYLSLCVCVCVSTGYILVALFPFVSRNHKITLSVSENRALKRILDLRERAREERSNRKKEKTG